jgi:hypothetical protein
VYESVIVEEGTSYELSISFKLNCGTDGLDAALVIVGVMDNTNKLDSNKKTNTDVKKLFGRFIIKETILEK